MKTVPFTRRPGRLSGRLIGAFAATAVLATTPAASFAQDAGEEARLRKIEAEIRALQRNVFPGGDGRFFEPQITGGQQAPSQPDRATTSALTDILARLDALELQLQRLTSLTEENTNALSRLDERITALETASSVDAQPEDAATDSNLAAMTGRTQGTNGDAGARERRIEPETLTAGTSVAAGTRTSGAQTAGPQTANPQTAGPSPERLAAVQAITKPDTGDAGEDEYTYGFRLWDAGFFPEARQQLSSFVEAYPDHPLTTFGRNLLGRAFLDDGMAEEAARWFLRNYQADRTARRAPDSLLYLAQSMIEMGDDRRACIALAEFGETYPAIASGRLADQYESNRRKVTCE
ncbi:tetratricopeptide repeat protein [Erythrobacter sp.]|jgi:TolA-binding protein|uniref:tetratricopeptide repeat protein n=1 Tax=Erythrobacter sp. TaxID=1042 RepID=UPI002EAE873F|nr:tetratricopeptide repeat protein [Erythrobacter sp.]